MATVFLSPQVYPPKGAGRAEDRDRHTLLVGTHFNLAPGSGSNDVRCVWAGCQNVADAYWVLDGVQQSDDYLRDGSFLQFPARTLTTVAFVVTARIDASAPAGISQFIVGTPLLVLPDSVFIENVPSDMARGSGVHRMADNKLRRYRGVNSHYEKAQWEFQGSHWKADRMALLRNIYNNYEEFYFIPDTLTMPEAGFFAVFGGDGLRAPYSTDDRTRGQNPEFTIMEV